MTKKVCIIVGVLLTAICVCVAAALIFPVDKTAIYSSDNISVKQVEYEERQYRHYSRLGVTADDAFTNNAVILSGTIRNVREAKISYDIDGKTGDSEITLFDMSASDVLFSSTDKLPKWGDLTIGAGYNKSSFAEGLPIFEEGKSYIMFCILTADWKEDPLETWGYADLWIFYPDCLVFEQMGDQVLVSNVFGNYFSKENTLTSRLGINATHAKQLKDSDNFVATAKSLDIKDDVGIFSSLEERYLPKSADFAIFLETSYLVEKDAFVELLREKASALW